MKSRLKILFSFFLALGMTSCAEKFPEPEPSLGFIKLSSTKQFVFPDRMYQMTAELQPSNIKPTEIVWKSTDPSIAEISSDGLIKALKKGIVNISAHAGTVTANCTVIVSDPFVYSVGFDKTNVLLKIGEELPLSVSSYPELLPEDFEWKSSDPAVAKVEDGVVKTLKEGYAIVTVSAYGKSASCEVAVIKEEAKILPRSLTLFYGKKGLITVAVPESMKDKELVWKSSDEEKLSLEENPSDKNSIYVTANDFGEFKVSATIGGQNLESVVTVPFQARIDLKDYKNPKEFEAAVLELDKKGVTDYVIKGPYINTGFDEAASHNIFASTKAVSLDLSGVKGWPETKYVIKKPEPKTDGVYVEVNDMFIGAGKIFNADKVEPVHGFKFLKKVILPDEVECLGRFMFQSCPVLEEVVAPGAKYLHKDSFGKCKALKTLVLNASGNLVYGGIGEKNESPFNGCPAGFSESCTLVLNFDKMNDENVKNMTYFGYKWKDIKFE